MGSIETASLIWYQCTNWTEAATHGGDINTSASIVSNTANNIFDDVTNAERIAGNTDYMKIYFRNENTDDYADATIWISANTDAAGDAVWITRAGTYSQSGTPVVVESGAATFGSDQYVYVTTDLTGGAIVPGEKIYNSTDDSVNYAATISSVAATVITLVASYGGTAGGGKDASVASAASYTFYQPDTENHANALAVGTLSTNEYAGVWVKRIVNAGADGYNNNTFTLEVTNS
ncbi:MAG: hypothetical protein WC907_05050 [Acholeplasmataceae bacterium]